MALIPVRSTQPGPDGEPFVTEVGAEHLERWPDDYTPLAGEELIRYQLEHAGVAAEDLDEVLAAALTQFQLKAEDDSDSEPVEPGTGAGETPTDEPPAGEPEPPTATAKHAAAVDPSVSTD